MNVRKINKIYTWFGKKLYGVECATLSGCSYNSYTEHMMDDICEFAGQKNYYEMLKKEGIYDRDYEQIDVSMLDGEIVFALIFIIVRREKFDGGIILKFCENGCFLKWLQRLKEIDGD